MLLYVDCSRRFAGISLRGSRHIAITSTIDRWVDKQDLFWAVCARRKDIGFEFVSLLPEEREMSGALKGKWLLSKPV